jgi:hypothetical protein
MNKGKFIISVINFFSILITDQTQNPYDDLENEQKIYEKKYDLDEEDDLEVCDTFMVHIASERDDSGARLVFYLNLFSSYLKCRFP